MFHLKLSHIKPEMALGLSAVSVIAITAAMFCIIAPVLSYAEGWCTFFWDSHYISSMLSEGHSEELLKGFLLQFFACRWIGVCVMTVFVFFVSALAGVIIQKISKKRGV